MSDVFGCPIREIDGAVVVSLPNEGHEVVVTTEAFQKAKAESSNAQEFAEAIRAAIVLSEKHFTETKYALEQGIEAGTPTTDHSSEPQ